MMTRRTFVGNLTAVTAAAGLGFGGVFALKRRLALAEITPASLEPLRNGSVTLLDSRGRSHRARVKDVQGVCHSARFGAPATEQISLLLAADDPSAAAGFYRVETADLCLGDLYFSPVAGVGRDCRLEAVITRIV
jgi:hypothetical protein